MKLIKILLFCLLLGILAFYAFLYKYTHTDMGNKAYGSDSLNLCFTIDNNYPDHLLVTLFSIFENNHSASHYKIFIIEDNLSCINKYRLKSYILKNNHEVYFINTEMHELNGGKLKYNFLAHISKIACARLLLPSLLPKSINKVLYLDSDIIILSDIKELYDMPLGSNLAGMMKNDRDVKYPNFDFDVYHNSGVILINLQAWRENKIEEKMINFLDENKNNFFAKNPLYKFIDQDSINIALKGRIKTLPSKWNFLYWNSKFWGLDEPVFPSEIKLIHYIGGIKPWDFPGDDKMYSIYYSYWERSPFKADKTKYIITSKLKGPRKNEMLDIKR